MESSLPFIQRILLFVSISLATFLIVLDYSIANVALPYIAGDLAASTDEGTYVITAFAVGTSIGLAMTGFMTKRIGEIKLIVSALFLFTFLSLLCGMSINLMMIICARFVQGLVAGPLIPLSQSLLVKYSTSETKPRNLAIWSTIVVTAPIAGPILGGYLSDWYSWPWIFFINIPIGLFCGSTLWFILHKKESTIEKVSIDWIGIALLTLAVSSLQVFLDKGQQLDWWNSWMICALAFSSVGGFTYLIIREIWHEAPLLNLKLFKIPSFAISIVCLVISYAMYFGSVVLVPLWLQEFMGYNAEWAGLAVCTLGVAPLLFSILTPLIMRKIGITRTLMISFFFFAFGCFYSTLFSAQVDFAHIAFARLIFGFGFVCYITPLISMNIQEIPSEELASAAGIFHFLRAMVGAIGTAVFTTIWQRRTVFHHFRMGERVTIIDQIGKNEPQNLAILTREVDVQSALLAMNDTLYLMGWLFVGLIFALIVWKFFQPEERLRQPGETIAVD